MAKTRWAVDTAHSSVDFSVKHMMVSRVKGTFHTYDASIEADPEDLTTANIQFTIDVGSVDTGNDDRDKHLKSGDFFDADSHPKMTFKSTNIVKKSGGEYEVTGDLTIRGTTRPETFLVTYEGQAKDPYGNLKVGFSAEGSINRKEYGLSWNSALETGGVMVSDQVKISLEIQGAKQG